MLLWQTIGGGKVSRDGGMRLQRSLEQLLQLSGSRRRDGRQGGWLVQHLTSGVAGVALPLMLRLWLAASRLLLLLSRGREGRVAPTTASPSREEGGRGGWRGGGGEGAAGGDDGRRVAQHHGSHVHVFPDDHVIHQLV